MRSSACRRAHRTSWLTLTAASLAAVLLGGGSARAQECAAVPEIEDDICIDAGDSIADYEACYRSLYDDAVIPAFRYIAECSHDRAEAALKAGLESAGALVTGTIQQTLASIELTLAQPDGPSACIAQLNQIDALLQPFLEAERGADDLDDYRWEQYSFELLVEFTDTVLAARQNRAICDWSLERLREQLVLLDQLETRHLDYCQVLRDSAEYESASRIQSLAEWTVVDPDLDFNWYFNLSVTWNPQCGFYSFEESGTDIHYSPCQQATVDYEQTLDDLNAFAIGWFADHREQIVAVTAATASTIASLAGAGAASGPIGAAVGAVVGLVISGIEFFVLQHELGEFEDMIAAKESELADVVEDNYITEAQFNQRLATLCSSWEPVVESRIEQMLSAFDLPQHITQIDKYFALSDGLHHWYNELFLWATEPGPDGRSFLDELAAASVLRKRDEFDQEIFRVRTDQEIAAQRNFFINVKAQTTALDCSDIPPRDQRRVATELRSGVNIFNLACSSTMEALSPRTEPIALSGPAASDVRCAYSGFRSDVTVAEVSAGAGFTADIVVRDSAGSTVAQLAGVSSETIWGEGALPGFVCWSDSLGPWGTSSENRLAPGTYPLAHPDNIYGFSAGQAQAFREFVKGIDEGMRFKAIVCNRQLDTPIDLPREADACGIPVNF